MQRPSHEPDPHCEPAGRTGPDGWLMGQELIYPGRGKGPYWSAQSLMDTPERVRQVHEVYIRPGPRVILTNTYSVAPADSAKARCRTGSVR